MSNRGAILSGIGVGNPISQSEMLQAIALRQNKELQERRFEEDKKNRDTIRKGAAATYLTNALDKKDFLSGSPLDPVIVQGLDGAMKQGMELASKGADTPTIMMALSPTIAKLNEYQSKAKLIDSNIKTSVEKRKQFPGYNADALTDEAKKAAYFNADGTMKDISQIDPQVDYTSTVLQTSPEKVTTSQGIDEFVNKTPLSEESKEIQTMYGGRKRNLKYDIKKNYWEGVPQDENGNAITDHTGQPVGIDVKSETLKGNDGKPMLDETGQPFRVMDKNEFKGIMSRSPAIADYVNGQVIKHFRDAGAKQIPSVGSPEWEDMASHILYQELKTRSRASFKQRDIETKTTPLTKIELGIPAYAPKKGSGSGSDVEINDVYKEVKDLTDSKKEGMGAPLNELSSTAQTAILDMARKMTGENDLSQGDIYLKKDGNSVNIMSYPDNKLIAPLTPRDINLKVNTTAKPKQKVLEETKEKTYNYNGKTYAESALKKAAAASGVTLEEYKKAVGIK